MRRHGGTNSTETEKCDGHGSGNLSTRRLGETQGQVSGGAEARASPRQTVSREPRFGRMGLYPGIPVIVAFKATAILLV